MKFKDLKVGDKFLYTKNAPAILVKTRRRKASVKMGYVNCEEIISGYRFGVNDDREIVPLKGDDLVTVSDLDNYDDEIPF